MLLSLFAILALGQGCAIREERFNILSVEPKHVSPSYFMDDSEKWPNVDKSWRREHDFLGFKIITEEQTNIHFVMNRMVKNPVILVVDDCSGEIRSIKHPGDRFVGHTPTGKFEYEAVIEYRRRIGKAEHSYYDLFEKPTELCFHIQTQEMGFYSRGNTYRLQLNEEIKRIAEGL